MQRIKHFLIDVRKYLIHSAILYSLYSAVTYGYALWTGTRLELRVPVHITAGSIEQIEVLTANLGVSIAADRDAEKRVKSALASK